jgi:ribosomal protein RSM22 (predicted rRNA methylase)
LDPALPAALRAAIDRSLEGRARDGLAQRAGAISEGYRKGRASRGLVKDGTDALAYALTRTPATYAATLRALSEVLRLRPDFAPGSLLDAGAGPGGGSWAALEALPSLEACTRLDHSPAFLDLAATLAAAGPPALSGAQGLRGDLTDPALTAPEADLVLAAYALTEVAPEKLDGVVRRLWDATRGLILVIEPGSPDGWRRGLEVRRILGEAGARIVGPCPHADECALNAPDWCHFAQRLPRSRDHRRAKGGEAPFEDEKFFWIAAERPAGDAPEVGFARVIAPPRSGKVGIRLRLCRPDGRIEDAEFIKRDRTAFAQARRLSWGEALALPEDQ